MGTWAELSVVDWSYLAVDTKDVPMHVGAVLLFDIPPHWNVENLGDEIRHSFERLIDQVPRLSQKVALPPLGLGRPVWVDDETFDVARHVRVVELDPASGDLELAETAQALSRKPLNRSFPLWRAEVILREMNRAALLITIHHALADGTATMEIIQRLFGPRSDTLPAQRNRREPTPAPRPIELLINALAAGICRSVETTGALAIALTEPAKLSKDIVRTTMAAGSLLATPHLTQGPFPVPLGPDRRFVTVKFSLADIRATRLRLGATTNQLLLSLVGGALSSLLRSQGRADEFRSLRTAIPKSTRSSSQQHVLGNRATIFTMELPVGQMDETDRLKAVGRALLECRPSEQAKAFSMLARAAEWTPSIPEASLRTLSFVQSTHLLVSVIVGPQDDRFLAGAPLTACYAIPPLGQSVPLIITIVILAGVVGVGVMADPSSIGDVEKLAAGFDETFNQISAKA